LDYHTFCQKFNICGLNEQQEAAVRRVNGATLLLAVPGSGKTTVIVARAGYLMYVAGVKPENILTITYTRAAAKEMKERFIKKFAPERIPAFSTINSFCLSVINTCAKEKYIHVPKLVPNNESIVRAIAAKMLPEYPSDSQVRSLAQKVCKVKNKLMTFQEIEAIEENSLDFSAFYQAYKLYMSEHDLMDFDDQLLMANDLLDEYPDILQRAHEKFRYVSVDEAQDTSYVQHLIVQKLVGRNGNIFMVGDEDQSIYGFRGAYPAALLDFQSNYNEPCILRMETNYRSDRNIVSAANQFIKLNTRRLDKNMRAQSQKDGAIVVTCIDRMEQQAELLLERIRNQKPDESLAILYRNNDSAIPLINLLQMNGIQVQTRDATGTFMTNYVIRDLLDFMLLALNPADTTAFGHLYYKMGLYMKGVTAKRIIEAVEEGECRNVFSAAMKFAGGKGYAWKIECLPRDFSDLAKKKPAEAIDYILFMLDYWSNWLTKKIDAGASEQFISLRISILKMVAEKYSTIPDFLAALKNITEYKGCQDSNVTVTTIHSSKGLEFDKVILIDMVSGIIPGDSDDRDAEDDEEDARAFYVGATRARHELEIITCRKMYQEKLEVSEFVPRLLAAGKGD
jgi:uvrD/REP helicase